MNPYQSLKWHRFLEKLLRRNGSAAIVLADGRPLHICYENLADIGTFVRAAQSTQQYLQLKDQEMAILNDPYSGGTFATTITICIGLDFTKKSVSKKSADAIIALRIPFRPTLNFVQKLDDEGVRIPPTPLGTNIQQCQEILKAIESHPSGIIHFAQKMTESLTQLQNLRNEFLQGLKLWELDTRPLVFNGYFQHSFHLLRESFAEAVTPADTKVHLVLDQDEKLKLHLEFDSDKLLFDFQGTSTSLKLHMTDAACFGACVGATLAFLEKPIPINAGVLRFFEVRSPAGSFVNSQSPNPTFLGMTDGVAHVANISLRAFSKLCEHKAVATSGTAESHLEIIFSNQLKFYDSLSGGSAGSQKKIGQDGIEMWKRPRLQASIEEIENRFPLQISEIRTRTSSGGDGKHPGGNGLTKSYRLLQPAKVKWFLQQHVHRPEGILGGFHGHEASLVIQRGNASLAASVDTKASAREKMTGFGVLDLLAGDQIFLHSPGAGGCGQVISSSEN